MWTSYTRESSQTQRSHVDCISWATVCKTVRPMPSDRCLSCPVMSVCLSVMLVYCGQTVGWIEMKLGMEVGLGHIVLDRDLAPTKGAQHPRLRPMSIVAKRLSISATVEHFVEHVTRRSCWSRTHWLCLNVTLVGGFLILSHSYESFFTCVLELAACVIWESLGITTRPMLTDCGVI